MTGATATGDLGNSVTIRSQRGVLVLSFLIKRRVSSDPILGRPSIRVLAHSLHKSAVSMSFSDLELLHWEHLHAPVRSRAVFEAIRIASFTPFVVIMLEIIRKRIYHN